MALAAALATALALVPASPPAAGLAAVAVRAADHPAYVRVVTEFVGGVLGRSDPTVLDPRVWSDGVTRLEIAHPGIRTGIRAIRVQGVRVELVEGRDRLLARLASAPHRFKYVSYRVLHSPERLVVDLWKSGVPVRGAAIRDDGCLRITRATGGPDVSLAGRELRWLFEHTVVVRLRGETGRLLAERPLIAGGGPWGTS